MSKRLKSTDLYGKEYEILVSELSWRPAAYAIVTHGGKVLLVKERGLYHLPGGGLDLGETPEAGVVREVWEETGLEVANPRLVGNLSTFFTLTHKNDRSATGHVQSLLLYFCCEFIGGTLSLDNLEEDEKIYGLTPEWVPVESVADLPLGSTVDWRPIVAEACSVQ